LDGLIPDQDAHPSPKIGPRFFVHYCKVSTIMASRFSDHVFPNATTQKSPGMLYC
jgi:hypothetical protein